MQKISENMNKIYEYCQLQIKRHRATRQMQTTRDFIDMYIEQLDTGTEELSGVFHGCIFSCMVSSWINMIYTGSVDSIKTKQDKTEKFLTSKHFCHIFSGGVGGGGYSYGYRPHFKINPPPQTYRKLFCAVLEWKKYQFGTTPIFFFRDPPLRF